MSKGKAQIEWQIVFQKLFFARACCQQGEQAEAKPVAIAMRQSALLQIYASLNAFIDFILTQSQAGKTQPFSMQLLMNWEQTYPAIAEAQHLANAFSDSQSLQELWQAIEKALSARPLQYAKAPNEQALAIMQAEGELCDAEDWKQLRQWIAELDAIYDNCATTLDEY